MFAASIAGLLFVFLYILLGKEVIIPLATTPPSQQGALQAINALGSVILTNLILLPAVITSIASTVLTNLQTNWKTYLVLGALVGVGATYVTHEREIWQVFDSFDTNVWRPSVRFVWLPIFNFIRIIYDLGICWVNMASGLGSIVRNVIFTLLQECEQMDWNAVVLALVDFSKNFIQAFLNFIASGFTDDLSMTPGLNSAADFISAFKPGLDCQCNDLSPAWDWLVDPTSGLIQSKNLHNFIDTSFMNMWLEYSRVHISMVVSIFDQAFEPCEVTYANNSVLERECKVSRGPKYARSMDKTCAFFTHGFGFIDDALYQFVNVFTEIFDEEIQVPRVMSTMAPIFCYTWDVIFDLLDAFFHVDLFFTMPSDPGNYFLDIDIARPYSRLYNITRILENDVGGPLGIYTDQYLYYGVVLLAEPLNITFALTQALIETVRYSAATGNRTMILSFLQDYSGIVNQLLLGIQRDADDMASALSNLGDQINESLGNALGTLIQIFSDMAKVIAGIVSNLEDFPSYIQTGDLQADLDKLYNHSKAFAIAISNFERDFSFGANAGSCYIRAPYTTNNPENIDEIPNTDSDTLDPMCTIANSVELSIRLVIAVLQYVTDLIISGITALIPSFSPTVSFNDIKQWTLNFAEGGNLDMEKVNGIIPIACMLIDELSGMTISLVNSGPTAPVCPADSGTQIAAGLHEITKRSARLALIPIRMLNWIMRVISYAINSDNFSFGSFCSEILQGFWVGVIVPSIDTVAEIFTVTECFMGPDNSISLIGKGIRYAFVDTSGRASATDDCNVAPDGGYVVEGLCGFLQFLQQMLDFIVDVFTDGLVNAILTMIKNWIDQLVENLKDIFDCIFGSVVGFFNNFVTCVTSGFISCSFGFDSSCENLFNSITPEIPTDFSTTPSPPQPPAPVGSTYTDIRGACCMTNGECSGSSSNPLSTVACRNAYATGPNILFPGTQCLEQNACLSGVFNSSYDDYGACWNAAGCTDVTYSVCALNTSSVFVAGEKCSALDENGYLETPAVEEVQLGCCVTEYAAGVNQTRGYVPNVSGQGCFILNGATATNRAYYFPGDPTCEYTQNTSFGEILLNTSDTTLDNSNLQALFPNFVTRCCSPDAYIDGNVFAKFRHLGCKVIRYGESDILSNDTVDSGAYTAGGECPIRFMGTTTKGGYDHYVASQNALPERITGDVDNPGLKWACRPVGENIMPRVGCTESTSTDPECTPWADISLTDYADYIVPYENVRVTGTAFSGSQPLYTCSSTTPYPGCLDDCGFGDVLCELGCYASGYPYYYEVGASYYATNPSASGYPASELGTPTYRTPYFDNCPSDDAINMQIIDVVTSSPNDGTFTYPRDHTGIWYHPATERWKSMRVVYFDLSSERPPYAPNNTSRDNTDIWCDTYFHMPDPTLGMPSTTGTTGTTGTTAAAAPDEMPPPDPFTLPEGIFTNLKNRFKELPQRKRYTHSDPAFMIPEIPPEGKHNPIRPFPYEGQNEEEGPIFVGTNPPDRQDYWTAPMHLREAHYDELDYFLPVIPATRRSPMGAFNKMAVNMTNMIIFTGDASNASHPCNFLHVKIETFRTTYDPNNMNDNLTMEMVQERMDQCLMSSAYAAMLNTLLFQPDFYGKKIIDPLFMYNTMRGHLVIKDFLKCQPMIFRYMGSRLRHDEDTMNMSWYKYLDIHASEDMINSSLCRRVGYLFGELLVNDTLARHEQGDSSMPFLLAPLSMMSKASRAVKKITGTVSSDTEGVSSTTTQQAERRMRRNERMARQFYEQVRVTGPGGKRRLAGVAAYEYASSKFRVNQTGNLIDWAKLNKTRHALSNLVTFSASVAQRKIAASTARGFNQYPPAYASDSDFYNFCLDGSCIDCPILTQTISDIIEVVLACLEDYDNFERFLPNATVFPRNNTFIQPDDVLYCNGQRLELKDDIGIISIVMDATSWVLTLLNATEKDAYVFYGEWACFFTHNDPDDPTTLRFWFDFARKCDVFNGPSCHRGRAGKGLWEAAIQVTTYFAVLGIIAAFTGLPIPLSFLWAGWIFMVLSLAYFMSPLCFLPGFPLPLPQFPTCLMDDLYSPVAVYYERDCTDFSGIFPRNFDPVCAGIEGRIPVDCEAAPYNFDTSGFHTAIFLLHSIDPAITDYIRETEFIGVSWLRLIAPINEALSDVQNIEDDQEALGCIRRWYPSLVTPILLLLGLTFVILAIPALIYLILALLAGLLVAVVNILIQLSVQVALLRVPARGTYRQGQYVSDMN